MVPTCSKQVVWTKLSVEEARLAIARIILGERDVFIECDQDADDLGHSAEVQSLQSRIDAMLFYEERGRLVIITRSLLLTQLQV